MSPKGYDKEVFRYIGTVIIKGAVPYRDSFDIKPPFIYYVAALGEIGGIWGNWFIFSAVLAISCLIYYQSFRKISAVATLISLFFLVSLICSPRLSEGGGLTRFLTASFVLVLISLSYLTTPHYQGMVLGALCAAIFWTQQNEILAIFPFAFLFLQQSNTKGSAILKLLLGAGSATVAILSLYLLSGSLKDLWKQAFLYNIYFHIDWMSQSPLKIVILLVQYMSHYQLLTLIGILGVGCAMMYWHNWRNNPFLLCAIASLILEAWAISLSGRYYAHYFQGMLPYMTIMCFYLISAIWLKTKGGIKGLACVAIVIVMLMRVSPAQTVYSDVFELVTSFSDSAYWDSLPPLGRYLQKVRGRKGQFLTIRNAPDLALSTDYRIIAPNKWMVQEYFGDPKFEAHFGSFAEVLEGVEEYKTKYILDYSISRPFVDRSDQEALKSYLRMHYHVLLLDRHRRWQFLERNSS